MDNMGRNLQIIFLEIPPERILEEMSQPFAATSESCLRGYNLAISEAFFCRYAGGRWQCWSDDENRLFARDIGEKTIFSLPVMCGERYLLRTQNELRCRFEQTRAWRDAYHIVGQDLITTAYLAHDDTITGRRTIDFTWDAILRTDSQELNALLNRGVAENHFHLKGSTQSFSLSWCYMMNFPDRAAAKLSDIIPINCYSGISRGEKDNVFSHKKRVMIAACIRALLYLSMRIPSMDIWNEFEIQRKGYHFFGGISRLVEQTRYLYGSKRDFPDGSTFCLDYAMTEDDEGHYRLLAGERRLMYHWFRRSLAGDASVEERMLFYLYLLLKSHFRREFIQANRMVGFDNFATYQKRKDSLWDTLLAYEHESIYMAIQAPIDRGNVQSLEARITPKPSSWKLLQSIWKYDRSQQYVVPSENCDVPSHPSWTMKAEMSKAPFFYVIHFAKENDTAEPRGFWVLERHHALREKVRRYALTIADALRRSEYLRHRVHGIDACANEIGCRPEVFATEFRFLRNFTCSPQVKWYAENQTAAHIQATYHAGEDFLDIADGLRAIDEAIHFLNMQRGDRIGHALALGIDPHMHYEKKDFQIVQTAHDRLDDLVWLLFRGNELGVSMDMRLKSELEKQAKNLLDDIYPDDGERFSLYDYYESWHLRGDSPLLYRNGSISLPKQLFSSEYSYFMINHAAEVQRKKTGAVGLYIQYHYNPEARKRGNEVHVYDICSGYMDLIWQIQDKMQSFLSAREIAIECNPSSNVLIGTFRKYECHPMFRFSPPAVMATTDYNELNISINTDDLGIFDTSLEFEYALVAHALMFGDGRNGIARNPMEVMEYLEKIRLNGCKQTFDL